LTVSRDSYCPRNHRSPGRPACAAACSESVRDRHRHRY
jgi:hypothetical protein